MRVRYAHLCDYTSISNDGKPTISGIFNRIWATKFPFVLSKQVILFMCFVIDAEDPGETRSVTVEMVDPEHRPLLRADLEIAIEGDQTPGDFYFNWRQQQMKFLEPGPHILRIVAEGQEPWEVEFSVAQRESSVDG